MPGRSLREQLDFDDQEEEVSSADYAPEAAAKPKPVRKKRVKKEVRIVTKKVVDWKMVLGTAAFLTLALLILLARFAPRVTSFAHLAWKSTDSYLSVVVGQVGKLTVLPEDEIPTLIEVLDSTEFQNLERFTGLESGDILLVYQAAGKLVVYRPSQGKLLALEQIAGQDIPGVAGLSEDVVDPAENQNPDEDAEGSAGEIEVVDNELDAGQDPETESEATGPITIEVRNATGESGLASQTKQAIEESGLAIQVLATANAERQRAGSILINTSGRAIPEEIIQNILETYRADLVESLPNGEDESEADLVLLLGR